MLRKDSICCFIIETFIFFALYSENIFFLVEFFSFSLSFFPIFLSLFLVEFFFSRGDVDVKFSCNRIVHHY